MALPTPRVHQSVRVTKIGSLRETRTHVSSMVPADVLTAELGEKMVPGDGFDTTIAMYTRHLVLEDPGETKLSNTSNLAIGGF